MISKGNLRRHPHPIEARRIVGASARRGRNAGRAPAAVTTLEVPFRTVTC
jgi:hypothetical protein